MRKVTTLSPVYWAGASLKAVGPVTSFTEQSNAFPGLLGRGLIEGLMTGASRA